jgi:WD40 repeat protein
MPGGVTFLAQAGNSRDDHHAMLFSAAASNNTVHWKCRLPETMSTGLLPFGNNEWIVGGGQSGKCYLWAARTGQLTRVWTAHHRPVQALLASQCGTYLVTGGADGVVHSFSLWHLLHSSSAGGNNSIRPMHTWSHHYLPVTALVRVGRSATRFASASTDRHVILMDLTCPKHTVKIAVPTGISSLCSTISRLYAGGTNGHIYCIDLDAHATAQTAESAKISTLETRNTTPLNSFSNTSRIANAILGMPSKTDTTTTTKDVDHAFVTELEGHVQAVTCLALLPNNDTQLVSGGKDGTVRIWDLDGRIALRVLQPFPTKVGISSLHVVPRASIHADQQSASIEIPPLGRFLQDTSNSSTDTNHLQVTLKPCRDDLTLKGLQSSTYITNMKHNTKKRRLAEPQDVVEERPNHDARTKTNEEEDRLQSLQKELEEAKATIERWEKVNNKLAAKLKKATA